MTSPTDSIRTVKEWLLARRPDLDDIGHDLDLIENRVIDSLGFMDFVFFLEELAERELDVEAGSVESFRTLQKIDEVILQSVAGPPLGESVGG